MTNGTVRIWDKVEGVSWSFCFECQEQQFTHLEAITKTALPLVKGALGMHAMTQGRGGRWVHEALNFIFRGHILCI